MNTQLFKIRHQGQDANVKLTVGGEEIIGIGSWKFSTIPWYLKWWYWLKIRRVYRHKQLTSKENKNDRNKIQGLEQANKKNG